jgi:NAD(P)-dependent dehydrogenase (short-subunit alcohol dehydrogenase family)
MRLRDKVAIVTGASSGFGRMTAARFGEEGAKVVIADVDGPGAEETGAIVKRTGGEAELVIGDISTMDGAGAVVDRAVERFGTVDILVNNAGISQREAVDTWNCAEETWDRILQVDLKSVFVCTKAALPIMLEQGHGAVVSLASIAASCSIGGAAYAAAKGGIVSYTRHVAPEIAARGVRINCVSPGFMRTPMSTGERYGLSQEEQDARIAAMGALVPFKRAGSPIDIAEAVLFLASEEAGYITGQELVVDGGYLVR